MNPIEVQKKLRDSLFWAFTPLEFQRVFRISEAEANNYLKYRTKTGLFIRLKNGLYALASNPPSDLVIANKLYQPSYVSFEYAMSYHHLVPETVYTITSATTKPTREFDALDKVFHYYKIKNQAYQGYEPRKIDDVTVLIAEPEKALIDYLYFVSLGKKMLNKRISTRGLDKKKALEYAKVFGRESLISLTQEVL